MNVLILANPFSGTGPNRKRVGELVAALEARGLSAEVVWEPGERIAALQQLEGDDPIVVAAGGDGSIADVVNDMDAAGRLHLRFATLPVGNENLLAQYFGFTLKAEPMAAAIARGETQAVDLVRLRSLSEAESVEHSPSSPAVDRLFTLMASSGFDAEVIHRLDRWRKNHPEGELRRVNRRRYLLRIFEAIRGYRYPGVTLVADGKEVAGHQAYVFNMPMYGGGLKFAPDARADDQQLDWVVFERPGFLRLLGYHWLVVRGKHLRGRTVACGRASKIILRTTGGGPVPTQADGDPAGHTPLDMTVLPGALRVIRV